MNSQDAHTHKHCGRKKAGSGRAGQKEGTEKERTKRCKPPHLQYQTCNVSFPSEKERRSTLLSRRVHTQAFIANGRAMTVTTAEQKILWQDTNSIGVQGDNSKGLSVCQSRCQCIIIVYFTQYVLPEVCRVTGINHTRRFAGK